MEDSMNRKLFVLILLTLTLCAISFAQDKKIKEVELVVNGDAIEEAFPFEAMGDFNGLPGLDGSYLGVQMEDVTKDNFSKLGLNDVRGVAVKKVIEDSPAAKAGLQAGDVITRFNGEEVTSVRKLQRLISEVAPDHQAKISIIRGGNEREVTATIGKRAMPQFNERAFNIQVPAMPRMPSMPRMPAISGLVVPMAPMGPDGDIPDWKDGGNFVWGNQRQIGVGVSDLTKQLGEYFGVADGKGLLIDQVIENSPAAKAGLKAGDVIIEVDGKSVDSTLDLMKAVNEKKEGDITLTIIRNRDRQTIKVTPEKRKDSDLKTFKRIDGKDGIVLQAAPRVRVERRMIPGVATPAVRVFPRSMIL
jgi:serine protease Do